MDGNIRKLKDQADRYRLKGMHGKAADAYLQLRVLEPQNARWPHLAAEQLRRLGRTDQAADLFAEAAATYEGQGLGVQAVALAKLALEASPGHAKAKEVLRRLARSQEDRVAQLARRNLPTLDGLVSAGLSSLAGGDAKVAAAKASGSSPPPIPEGASPPPIPGSRAPRSPSRETLDGLSLREVYAASRSEAAAERSREARIRAVESARTEKSMVRAVSAFEIPILEDEPPAPEPRSPMRSSLAGRLSGFQKEHRRAVQVTPLFGEMDARSLDTLVESMRVVEVPAGEFVVRQGQDGEELYVVVEGALEVFREKPRKVSIGTLKSGDFFGEIALVTALPRQASVRALEDSLLLEIGREQVIRLLQEHPEVVTIILRFFLKRMVDILVKTSPLFADLDDSLRADIMRKFRFLEVEPQVRIIHQGKPLPGLFVILSGKAQVLVASKEGRRVLVELSTGDIVGETALISGQKAVASVESLTKCWMLFMPARDFREKVLMIPELVSYLRRLWSERLAAAKSEEPDKQFPVERLTIY